jgi:hypothetical protein
MPPVYDLKSYFSSVSILSKDEKENREGPTPGSTPTSSRKYRRRSNLFAPSKKTDDGGVGSSNKGNNPH